MQLQAMASKPRLAGQPLSTGGQRQRRQPSARRAVVPQAGIFDDIFDFEKWAPKSSQAWRLGNNPSELRRAAQEAEEAEAAASITDADVDVLNRRLADARGGSAGAAAGSVAAAGMAEDAGMGSAASADPAPSFLKSTDEELSAALSQRISQVASSLSSVGSMDESNDEDREDGGELNGPLLRQLMETKWGKAYDLSFVRRDLPLGKTLICLNVMWTHLEQRSFPMSEEEYDEKLDLIAHYLNSWGQSERVESFLRQPARPRKGMPSKPIVGTAISIQLDLSDAIINEFFSQGGA